MRRTVLALLLGIVIGVAGTFVAVEISGGWWQYDLLPERECHQGMALGTSHVAPSQPNPCLLRHPRFTFP